MGALSLNASNKHRDISALSTSVRMQFVKDEIPKVFKYRVPNRPFPHAGEQEFQHHVIGQEDLWWIVTHLLAPLLPLLAGILAKRYREVLMRTLFVVFAIYVEFVGLRIDECIHRIDDDCDYTTCKNIGQEMIEK